MLKHVAIFGQNSSKCSVEKNVILEQCTGVHCVDLGKSFQTHIYLQNLASIQPRTSPVKFAASRESSTAARGRPQAPRRDQAPGRADPTVAATEARRRTRAVRDSEGKFGVFTLANVVKFARLTTEFTKSERVSPELCT